MDNMEIWFWWGTKVPQRGIKRGINKEFLLSTFGAVAMVPNLPGHPVCKQTAEQYKQKTDYCKQLTYRVSRQVWKSTDQKITVNTSFDTPRWYLSIPPKSTFHVIPGNFYF